MSSIGIILLNYNSTRLTKKCVQSLFATKEKTDTYHILIYDNDSKIPPKKTDFPEVELVHGKKNLGFAAGNNEAVKQLFSRLKEKKESLQYLLFLNNDTRVTKGMVGRLVETFEKSPDAGFVLPKIYFEKKHEFHEESYSKTQLGKVIWYAGGDIDWGNMALWHRGVDEVDRGQFDTNQEASFATGCCFLTTPQIWKKLGGFDSAYFLYYEDADLSMRLCRKLHKKIIVEQRSVLYHVNAGSTSGSGSSVHAYYQTRNRLRFGLTYAPRRTQLSLLLEARRMFHSGSDAVKLGILDALGGRWGNQSHRIRTEKH